MINTLYTIPLISYAVVSVSILTPVSMKIYKAKSYAYYTPHRAYECVNTNQWKSIFAEPL